jgi:hypothetical protein
VDAQRSFAKITRAHGYFPTLAEAVSGVAAPCAGAPTPVPAPVPAPGPGPGPRAAWGRGQPAPGTAPGPGKPGPWGRGGGPAAPRPSAAGGPRPLVSPGGDLDDGAPAPPPRIALSLGDILSEALKGGGEPAGPGDGKGSRKGQKKKAKGVPLFSTAAVTYRR